LLVSGSFACAFAVSTRAGDGADAFSRDVRPLLERFCFDCHDSGKAKAEVNLEQFDHAAAIWKNPKLWERVLVQLKDRTMPPAKKTQPSDEERARLTAWLQAAFDAPAPADLPPDPGGTVLRRLNRLEYNNTLRDLLGVDTRPADHFPPDGGGGGGFDNNAATLFTPPVLMEKYLVAAGEALSTARPERIFHTRPDEHCDERHAARENLSRFTSRAYRRPAEESELTRLVELYDSMRSRGDDFESAVKAACQAALVTPQFLFRIEEERPGATEPHRISDHELASRLSYFLWSSMPDEELSRLAVERKLSAPATLTAQVHRMLLDPKARTFAENFASQWLRTKELRTSVEPAPDKFPAFTPELRAAFYEEPVAFFHALLRENRPLTDCLDADYTFANETLAKHYGIAGVTGPEMRRVAVPDRSRGGVLGMGGVLTLTSYPRRTSPVLRGVWVLEEILGSPPPPPPPLVVTTKVERHQDGLTFRQRLEQHREEARCAGCHARMDPLGFGLENFDAVGAWRTDERGTAIDASGRLATGEAFTGPAELKTLLLARKGEFVRTLTEKMLAYSLGRGIEPCDWFTVREISRAVAADGYRAQTLITAIVQSYPFQHRRPSPAASSIAQTPP
jgi:hypothetical protein